VHGIVRDDRALTSSFLVLTPGPGSGDPAADGTLTASEIYSLDLRADLVVLSACRSASGRITGDGIVGLTRAFMYAGAASVVASIWDVPDETAPRLFEAFYRSRAAGSDPSQALRDAQLEMLQRLRAGAIEVTTPAGRVTLPAHPAIWAGLQVWGEP
jgi:CHAT domain-containing protein